jgi:hypothetical protein
VRLSPLGTAATTGVLYQPQMIDEGDCGEIGGMKICRGNRSTRRKPAPAPLCPPQIPHDQTRARTRAAAVGSLRLTAWATARPTFTLHTLIWRRVSSWGLRSHLFKMGLVLMDYPVWIIVTEHGIRSIAGRTSCSEQSRSGTRAL